MESTATLNAKPTAQSTKSRFRWRRLVIILCIGIFGGLVGWNKAEQKYSADSQEDVQAVVTAIDGLLDVATADKMSQILTRDDEVAAVNNLSQAMSKLQDAAKAVELHQTLEREYNNAGAVLAYPNYNAARDKFLITFSSLHSRKNLLKATILYYGAAGWYPRVPIEGHDWHKVDQDIPWDFSRDDTNPEHIGFAIGYGCTMAIFAWLLTILVGWTWKFILARIREVSHAIRGQQP